MSPKCKHRNNGQKCPVLLLVGIGKNQFPARSWHLRLLERKSSSMRKLGTHTHKHTHTETGYVRVNQRKSTKARDHKWIPRVYTIWIEARIQQAQECGPICFMVEKFPREAKCLDQGCKESRAESAPSVYHEECVASRANILLSQEICLWEQLFEASQIGLPTGMACLPHSLCKIGLEMR